MYAVIFKATFKQADTLDDAYFSMAKQLQQKAKSQYACQDFFSLTEGDQELAISYWLSMDDIQAWKQDPLHQSAQRKGAELWYESYSVEVVEVIKHYSQPNQ